MEEEHVLDEGKREGLGRGDEPSKQGAHGVEGWRVWRDGRNNAEDESYDRGPEEHRGSAPKAGHWDPENSSDTPRTCCISIYVCNMLQFDLQQENIDVGPSL